MGNQILRSLSSQLKKLSNFGLAKKKSPLRKFKENTHNFPHLPLYFPDFFIVSPVRVCFLKLIICIIFFDRNRFPRLRASYSKHITHSLSERKI